MAGDPAGQTPDPAGCLRRAERRDGRDQDGRLCVDRLAQIVLWSREAKLGERKIERRVGFLENGPRCRLGISQIAAHADRLGSLAEKEPGRLRVPTLRRFHSLSLELLRDRPSLSEPLGRMRKKRRDGPGVAPALAITPVLDHRRQTMGQGPLSQAC